VAPNDKQPSTYHDQTNQVTQPDTQHACEKDKGKAPLFRWNEITKAKQLVYVDAPHVWICEGSSIKNQWIKKIDGIFSWLVTLDSDPDVLCFSFISDH
jgi:hypothetical protein